MNACPAARGDPATVSIARGAGDIYLRSRSCVFVRDASKLKNLRRRYEDASELLTFSIYNN
jgi:hypothetical protein